MVVWCHCVPWMGWLLPQWKELVAPRQHYIQSRLKLWGIWSIYEIHILISLHGKIWTQQIDLAPNVWLHSSVGWALHWFETRWSPDIFQAPSFQLLKLENLLRWSLFTFLWGMLSRMIHGSSSVVPLDSENVQRQIFWTKNTDKGVRW